MREIGGIPSKSGVFLFQRGYHNQFPYRWNSPRFSNLIKKDRQGPWKKSLKALIRGNGISKGRTLIFLSFPILLSISDGETEGREGERRPVGN